MSMMGIARWTAHEYRVSRSVYRHGRASGFGRVACLSAAVSLFWRWALVIPLRARLLGRWEVVRRAVDDRELPR